MDHRTASRGSINTTNREEGETTKKLKERGGGGKGSRQGGANEGELNRGGAGNKE